jgi:hypothetical protein
MGLANLALLAAGCGDSPASHVAQLGTTTNQSSTSTSSSAQQTGAVTFSVCMRAHGVPNFPDPSSRGSSDQSPLTLRQLGVSSSQLAAAEKACRSPLATPSVSQQSPQVLAQALRFSQCMRAHGATNFPDPEQNGAIAIPHAMENSPAYLAALHSCLQKYGAPPPPSPAAKR